MIEDGDTHLYKYIVEHTWGLAAWLPTGPERLWGYRWWAHLSHSCGMKTGRRLYISPAANRHAHHVTTTTHHDSSMRLERLPLPLPPMLYSARSAESNSRLMWQHRRARQPEVADWASSAAGGNACQEKREKSVGRRTVRDSCRKDTVAWQTLGGGASPAQHGRHSHFLGLHASPGGTPTWQHKGGIKMDAAHLARLQVPQSLDRAPAEAAALGATRQAPETRLRAPCDAASAAL